MATLYDTLEVHEDATNDEIKRAYRKAAMKAHPDRNVGREAAAHAHFQEIKEAYAILSDPEQRRVYDEVYAEEMGRLARQREQEERRLQAKREAQYTRFVALAMRFAEQDYNRDVVLGVLLGHNCAAELAGRIADSVVALHASRRASASQEARETETATEPATKRTENAQESGTNQSSAAETKPKDGNRTDNDPLHASFFSTLWQGMFGLNR
jgi:curved DNA-binding protein CbpA